MFLPDFQSFWAPPWKLIQNSALNKCAFLIKDVFFSCRSANLPENTSKISRGIQWKISRHSLENIENIRAFNGKYKGNLMDFQSKGGAAAPPLFFTFHYIPFIFSIECVDIFHWMPADMFDVFSGRFFKMHFFGLIFIEAFKMAENTEKQVFTFFAFLPPYFGVSGSLVSRNG